MAISSKVSGKQKTVTDCKANVGGTWKQVTTAYTKVSGTWKEVWANNIIASGVVIQTTKKVEQFDLTYNRVTSIVKMIGFSITCYYSSGAVAYSQSMEETQIMSGSYNLSGGGDISIIVRPATNTISVSITNRDYSKVVLSIDRIEMVE